MAYDEVLAERIRELITDRTDLTEKKSDDKAPARDVGGARPRLRALAAREAVTAHPSGAIAIIGGGWSSRSSSVVPRKT